MRIKRIKFAHEITDPYMDNLDVFVQNEDDYTYTIVVSTPGDLVDQIDQKTANIKPLSATLSKRSTLLCIASSSDK